MTESIIVIGGAGFIWLAHESAPLINLDTLTYAGNLANLASVSGHPRYSFVHGDINDRELVRQLFDRHQPAAIVHFAAESHVDRSILGPEGFVRTKIHGTFTLLEAAREYYGKLIEPGQKQRFRFLHVSTDEVYGSLGEHDPAFSETTANAPNSPYAASKAASDHLVRAWFHTFELPTLTTNCSNNYGPFQFPEKLIPLIIYNAFNGRPLPVYGDGQNVRDWLYVEDHCSAIRCVLRNGRPGETYNIGGGSERRNLDVVRAICSVLNELRPESPHVPHAQLIKFVDDRAGHDRRYAINSTRIEQELGWKPQVTFEDGIRATVGWYLQNQKWVTTLPAEAIVSGSIPSMHSGRGPKQVLSLIGSWRKPSPLPSSDTESLKVALPSCQFEPHPYLVVSETIRIHSGALAGMVGSEWRNHPVNI